MLALTAPSRLHFGLWSLAGQPGRQFGGVGAMIECPALQLTLHQADQFQLAGRSADRAYEFAQRWAQFHGLALPACRIVIAAEVPRHSGLGSGTQLALAIAAVLSRFTQLPDQSPRELALSVGRGLRSAVGTYGFAFGGLIGEQGKQPNDDISPLHCRVDLPAEWRFVLARPAELQGLSGVDESLAFASLPPVPSRVNQELMELALDQLVPAAASGDFSTFAASLYRYGRLSGECFAARQGGPYNGPVLTQLIESVRAAGYEGVGQSSWGPTVFVAVPSQRDAQNLADWLAAESSTPLDIKISRPANQGATVATIISAT